MRYFYEACISEEDDGFVATFPQFPFAVTQGDTYKQCIERAAECLELEVASILSEGKTLPEFIASGNPYVVICFNVTEEMLEECRCLTIAEAADELGVSRARISQLIKSGGLQAVEINGKRLVTIASVVARKECPPPAHRPKKETAVAVV